MATGLNNLKNTLGVGSRANKYKIKINQFIDSASASILCKAASFPSKTMGQIEVMNLGRKIILAGDAQFEHTWDLTFWNTQDHNIRQQFDAWMTSIDDVENDVRALENPDDYMTTAEVDQISATDGTSSTIGYTFYNLFPVSISNVDFSSDSADTITEFTVTLAFSHFDPKS